MSRSLKKTPGFTNSGSSHRRFAKREANVQVRNTPDVPNGGAYKMCYCSWNIEDYSCIFYTKNKYRKYAAEIRDDEKNGWYFRRTRSERELMSAIKKPLLK